MIPISNPVIAKNAQKYLLDVLNSGWVSSKGPMVEKFEKAFAKFAGTKFALAVSSGTAAVHLSLACLDIGPGDEVIVPTLTMVAAALPIIYLGATPILVDSDQTGNLNPKLIEAKISKKTKAIVAVDLNGNPIQISSIKKICKKYKLALIEDAAESHGSLYKSSAGWRRVGSEADLGCFSFYGNKLITTGEGGMVVTSNPQLAEKIKDLRNFARTKNEHFLHQTIGFSYRMSSLQASLGLAQIEQAQAFIKIKISLAKVYDNLLKDIPGLIPTSTTEYSQKVPWHYDLLVSSQFKLNRNQLASLLSKKGVETRNFGLPLHLQPAFLKLGLFKGEKYPVAERIASQGISLPLGLNLKKSQIEYICQIIKKAK